MSDRFTVQTTPASEPAHGHYEIRPDLRPGHASRYKVFRDNEYLNVMSTITGARLYIWSHRYRMTKIAALNRKYAKEGS